MTNIERFLEEFGWLRRVWGWWGERGIPPKARIQSRVGWLSDGRVGEGTKWESLQSLMVERLGRIIVAVEAVENSLPTLGSLNVVG